MKLPDSVQEIADVIGVEPTMQLIRNLPRCMGGSRDRPSERVILYVPKSIKPHHRLVEILGWDNARKLVEGFGGEILQPANCRWVFAEERNREIRRRWQAGGVTKADLARAMNVTERHIRNIVREIPPEELCAANDNTEQD